VADIQHCLTRIEKAVRQAGNFTDKQLDKMLEDAAERVAVLGKKHRNAGNPDIADAVIKEIDDHLTQTRIANAIMQRNALLNKKVQLDTFDYIMSTWGDLPVDGFRAILRGSAINRSGAGFSVARSQTALADRYLSALYSDLAKQDLWRPFQRGVFDEAIYEARWRIDKGDDVSDLPAEAVTIAKALQKHQEHARQQANRHGAYIGKLPGFVTSRTHDADKIRANKDAWLTFMLDPENVDYDKTFSDVGEGDLEALLKDLRQGFMLENHLRRSDPKTHNNIAAGTSSVAKRMSHERVIHFKSAKAEFEYAKQFGNGNLAKSILFDLERMAADTALMKHLGPNAEMNLDELFDKVMKRLRKEGREADEAALVKYRNWAKKDLFPHITGQARAVTNPTGAKVNHLLTAWQQATSLGAAMISMPSDLALIGGEAAFQGRSFFAGMVDGLRGLAAGRTQRQYYDILSSLAVMADGTKGSALSRFDIGDPPMGRVANGMQLFFKYTGIQWWPDRVREGFVLGMSHWLARNADTTFDGLPNDLQRMLKMSGFDADEWDTVLRKGVTFAEKDDRAFLTSDGFLGLGDEDFAAVLTKRGVKPTKSKIAALRDDMDDRFRTMFQERTIHAVIEGDVQTRAAARGGAEQGDWMSVMRSQVALLKTFPVAVIQRSIGRSFYSHSSTGRAIDGAKNFGAMAGLATTVAAMTALGYVSMAAKDLLKGREVRVPDDMESFGKVLAAALLQGGGLGLYGDFLFGQANRFGGNFVTSLMGPTVGDANTLYDIYDRMLSPDRKDAGAQAFKFAINSIPGSNIFYIRPIMDYLILNSLTEMINPGYKRRVERRIKKENDQRYGGPLAFQHEEAKEALGF